MTDLSVPELRKFHEIRGTAPFRHSMVFVQSAPIKDVPGVLDWLGSYLRHVDTQVAKLREDDMVRARAAVVLRGLRQDIENAASTIAELDAALDAGTLVAVPVLPGDDE